LDQSWPSRSLPIQRRRDQALFPQSPQSPIANPQSPQSPIPNPQSLHFRQPVREPLVEPRREQALGRDDVERLEAGDAREQVEIGGEEAIRVSDPVRDGDDDMAYRIGSRLADHSIAQHVLIAARRGDSEALVLTKG